METVTNLDTDTVSALKQLIRINIDSSKGFEHAASDIEDDGLAREFNNYAGQRSTYARDLAGYLSLNEADIPDSGTVQGTVHRWWLDVRSKVASGDRHSVLAEAERGEDAIKGRYERLLKDTAGSAVNDVLQKQYTEVKKAHDHIRDLRDAAV